MSDRTAELDRLFELMGMLCDEEATVGDVVEMDAIVFDAPKAGRCYARYCRMHSALKMELRAQRVSQSVFQKTAIEAAAESDELHGRRIGSPPPLSSMPAALVPLCNAAGFFSSGWPAAYLMATVILGIGILVSAVTYTSPPQPIALQPSLPAENLVVSQSQPKSVGRITGMIDGTWDDPATKVANGASVYLGHQYTLTAGLLEITYDTGAKVILQGPCTYEVESANGGFLSVGRLTARVEKKNANNTMQLERCKSQNANRQLKTANLKSHISNPPSPLPPPPSALPFSNPQSLIPSPSSLPTARCPLFTIKTPGARIVDLGTEFGVYVSKEGTTQVHVLRGAVEAQPIDIPGEASSGRRVTEGAAVVVEPKVAAVHAIAFAPQSFVRVLQPPSDTSSEAAYVKAILADDPMGYWPLNEPAGARQFIDRSGNRLHGYALGKVAAGAPGPWGEGSHAIQLDGNGYIDFGRRDQFAMKNGFTIEAWIWIGEVSRCSKVISVLGHEGDNSAGWSLSAGRLTSSGQFDAQNPPLLFFTTHGPSKDCLFDRSSTLSLTGRWRHVAAVLDHNNVARLYLDGSECGAGIQGNSAGVGPVWLTIGCGDVEDVNFWYGRLSHVAVYNRVLDQQQIANHLRHTDEKEVFPNRDMRPLPEE